MNINDVHRGIHKNTKRLRIGTALVPARQNIGPWPQGTRPIGRLGCTGDF